MIVVMIISIKINVAGGRGYREGGFGGLAGKGIVIDEEHGCLCCC